MPKRRTYSSSSYGYGREKHRGIPSPVPYLLVTLAAGAGLAYFHFFAYQSLQGKVSNAYTGAPMSGALVLVSSSASGPAGTPSAPQQVRPSVSLTATTGPDGDFSIEKLPPDPVLSVA